MTKPASPALQAQPMTPIQAAQVFAECEANERELQQQMKDLEKEMRSNLDQSKAAAKVLRASVIAAAVTKRAFVYGSKVVLVTGGHDGSSKTSPCVQIVGCETVA